MVRKASVVLIGLLSSWGPACDPGSTVSPPEGTPLPTPVVCGEGEVRIGSECKVPPEIKVDSVGYLPARTKQATVPASDAEAFQVVAVDTGEVAYEGDLTESTENADTGDTTQIADFSELDTEGTYVVRVDGLEDSPPFLVASGAWNEALRATMLGLYGQRCGVDVEFEYQGATFKHEACHMEDGIFGAEADASGRWSSGEPKDGTGGWHDAGDYGKYTVNGAFSLAFVLKAWEDFGDKLGQVQHIPGYDGELPEWLSEAKFQLDQLLKMQLEDGSASFMLGPKAFPAMDVMPEDDLAARHFSEPGTAATGDLAAVAAIASRVFRPYDEEYADRCLEAAQRGQSFLSANTTLIAPSYAGFTHAAYSRQDDTCERLWAQVELWRTTGDAELLALVESQLPSSAEINFDWVRVCNLGLFSYVQATDDARNTDVLAAARAAVIASAEMLVANAENHAYGRGVGSMYYWGINGVIARSVMNLFVANSVAPDPRYLDAAAVQVDHLFGRNPFGRSMLTGVGYMPVQSPHHRPSDGDAALAPWPGLLVGGPNPKDHPKAASYPELAPGLFWFDENDDYNSNEVAINWGTALSYALAGFLE